MWTKPELEGNSKMCWCKVGKILCCFQGPLFLLLKQQCLKSIGLIFKLLPSNIPDNKAASPQNGGAILQEDVCWAAFLPCPWLVQCSLQYIWKTLDIFGVKCLKKIYLLKVLLSLNWYNWCFNLHLFLKNKKIMTIIFLNKPDTVPKIYSFSDRLQTWTWAFSSGGRLWSVKM